MFSIFFGFLPSFFLFLMVFFQIFDVGPKILNDYKTYHKASSNVESWLVGLGGRGGGVASVKTKWVPPWPPTWPPLVEPLFGVMDIVPMLLLRSVW